MTQEGSSVGKGGGLSVSEINLHGMAIRNRWPISAEQRQSIVDTMVGIVTDARAKERARIAAAKVVLAADAQNKASITNHNELHLHGLPAGSNRDRLSEIAAKLGVVDVFESGSRE